MIRKLSILAVSSVILLSACSSEDTAKKEEITKAAEQKVSEQEKELAQKAAKLQSPEEMIKPYFNSLMDGDIDALKKVVIDEQQEDATQVFEQIKSQLSTQGIKVKVKEIISSKEQDGLAVVFYILEYIQQDKTTGYEINQLPFMKVGET